MSTTSYKAKGRVLMIYPDESGTYYKLAYNGVKPQHELFRLPKTHENYNALYSLALAAAVNKYHLLIRTREKINPNEYGDIVYMAVDF